MITKEFNIKRFYKELGRLLYAVAMNHKKNEEGEIIKINDFVSHELAVNCTTDDSSCMNHAFYTTFEFNDCIDNNFDAQIAHDSFMKFLRENIDLIDISLINWTVRGIEKIENAYKNKSEAEKELMQKVKNEINEIAKFRLKSSEDILTTDE